MLFKEKVEIVDPDREQMESPKETCAIRTTWIQLFGRRFFLRRHKLLHDLYIEDEVPLITRTVTTLKCRRCGKEKVVY